MPQAKYGVELLTEKAMKDPKSHQNIYHVKVHSSFILCAIFFYCNNLFLEFF